MSLKEVKEAIAGSPFHQGLVKYGAFKSFPVSAAKVCRGCGHDIRGERKRDFCSYRCTWKFPAQLPKHPRKVEPVHVRLALSEKEIAEAQARVGAGRWRPSGDPAP